MEKYTSPQYSMESIEASDIILGSIISQGEATVGDITGQKGTASFDFNEL